MATTASAGTMITGVDIFGPATTDAKRLIAFYRDVLGMKPTGTDDSEGGAEFELSDGTTFGVWQPRDNSWSGKGYTALFAVGDINAPRRAVPRQLLGMTVKRHDALQSLKQRGPKATRSSSTTSFIFLNAEGPKARGVLFNLGMTNFSSCSRGP